MFSNIFFTIAFIQFRVVLCDTSINDYFDIYQQNDSYGGEKFPQKYLSTDGVQPTMADFSHYLKSLWRVIDYFAASPNDTDPNVSLGSYFAKAVLKRTLIDYGHKMKIEEKHLLKHIINKAEYIVSHFVYDNFQQDRQELGFKLSRLFTHDESLVHSIGELNKNALQKWISSNIVIHPLVEEMDDMSLPREKYADLVINMDQYYKITDSDHCLATISTQPLPLKYNQELKPCRLNAYCNNVVLKMPSVAYALSHRLLYIMVLMQTRRCYIISEEADKLHMDIMCANMYRESVYLARRGYFYRDLFMEHIALCAMLGYEEFLRHNWFKKSASWLDEDGCMTENHNFEINRTRMYIAGSKTAKEAKTFRKLAKKILNDECQHHQMALATLTLANGIRHAAHYMDTTLR